MSKRALVAGVDDYRSWQSVGQLTFPALRYCAADANAFATLLTTAFGFAPDDIMLCENAEATMQGILGGIGALLSQAQPGDVVCFYFAGCGGRVPQNGWGQPSARYYDAIVPSDDAGMIFDYQLATLSQALQPPQVNFTIVLDTCHAGDVVPSDVVTTYRAYGWDDATITAFVSHCQTVAPLVCLPDPSALDDNVSKLAKCASGATLTADPTKNTTDQARALLLSACDYGEAAGESTNSSHGTLTQALLDVASQTNGALAPADLLAAVRAKVATSSGGHQTPQLRGRPAQPQETFLGSFLASL
jgi:uncharacterized caspase-like protein